MAKRRPPMNPDDTAPESMRAICRNVVVGGRRTSVRMEPLLWESLSDISRREGRNINDIVSMIDGRRGDSALTAALRIFILSYFRTASGPASPVAGLAEDAAPFTGPSFTPVFEKALGVFDEP